MCDCGKRIKHLLQERLDNLIEIEIDSKVAIDNGMENLFTHGSPWLPVLMSTKFQTNI